MILGYSFAWIPMVFIAILNGFFREPVLAKTLSELRAHQLSCLTGILLFFEYTWLISLSNPPGKSWPWALSGLILTVLFEFSFWHWVAPGTGTGKEREQLSEAKLGWKPWNGISERELLSSWETGSYPTSRRQFQGFVSWDDFWPSYNPEI
jgi:hypothetical protein